MDKEKITQYNCKELSIGTILEQLKEQKLADALIKFDCDDVITTDLSNKLKFIKKDTVSENMFFDKLKDIITAKTIDKNELDFAGNFINFIGDSYYERKNNNRTMFSDCFNHRGLDFISKSTAAYNEFFLGEGCSQTILDTLYMLKKNENSYINLIKHVTSTIKSVNTNPEKYISMLDIKDDLISIPKDKNNVYYGDINTMIKIQSTAQLIDVKKTDYGTDYLEALSNISDAEEIATGFLEMIKSIDFASKSFNGKAALKYAEKTFKSHSEIYLDDVVTTTDEGFKVFDYVKDSSDGLYNIETRKINTNENIEQLYEIWGTKFIDYVFWAVSIDNESDEEVELNREMLDNEISYGYCREVFLFNKLKNCIQESEDVRHDEKEHVNDLLRLNYITLSPIYYHSEEIDKYIKSNINDSSSIEKLFNAVGKINTTLAKLYRGVGEAEIIQKDSTLFPENCKCDYAIMSISNKEGELLETVNEETIDGTYINYLDGEQIESMNKGITELKNLLKKYTTKD